MDLLAEFAQDEPPPRPEGVHSKEPEEPSYSKMLATLVDQVKKEVDEEKPEDRKDEFIRKLQGHQEKIEGLQKELKARLDELEAEESRKITSDSIHTGFDSSFVNKADKKKSSTKQAAKPAKSVEVLNPHALKGDQSSSGGDVVEPSVSEPNSTKASNEATDDVVDDDTMEASELGKRFAKIKIGDYQANLEFIGKHPELVSAREADGLLAEAFEAQLAGKDEYAQQCVHQALLLQYCGSLGKDGVGLFFQRYHHRSHIHPVRFPCRLIYSIEEFSPKATKAKRSFMMMWSRHTPVYALAARRSRSGGRNRVRMVTKASSKSNYIPSSLVRPSTSSFRLLTARTRSNGKHGRSSRASRLACKKRWRVGVWTR